MFDVTDCALLLSSIGWAGLAGHWFARCMAQRRETDRLRTLLTAAKVKLKLMQGVEQALQDYQRGDYPCPAPVPGALRNWQCKHRTSTTPDCDLCDAEEIERISKVARLAVGEGEPRE